MQPSVGRVVHYVSHGTPIRSDGTQAYTAECRAAIITEVTEHPDADGTAGLAVFNPTGIFLNRAVPLDLGSFERDPDIDEDAATLCTGRIHGGGTWHWPERV